MAASLSPPRNKKLEMLVTIRVMDSPPQNSSFQLSQPPHRHFGTSRTFWIFFWVLAVSAVIMGIYLFTISHRSSSMFHQPPGIPTSESFSIVAGERLHWYQLTGSKATEVTASDAVVVKDGSISVIQVGTKLAEGTPVLARSSITTGPKGTLVGIVHTDGSFAALVSDGSQKEGLTTAPSGAVAYAAFTPASTTPAGAPFADLVFGQSNADMWNIVTLTVQNPTPHIVGQGYDPRFLHNGSILAQGNEGVVILNPANGNRTVLIPQAHLFSGMYAVSADLTRIVLTNPPSSFDVYSFDQSTLTATKLGSLPILPPVTFLLDGRLLNLTNSTSANVYNVTQLSSTKVGTITMQPITPHAP